ncbi:MAG TPA: YwiC-like family protein [Acidimicrobiales bacterium]|nr:YwiC-like family protein [Acidimicrobiales bacterium]
MAATSTDTRPAAARPVAPPQARPAWRAVALPDEHGGWGLSAEPALLGLLVAPSWAGGALAAGAVLAFLARTPLKLVLVDRWRGRWLPRTRLAARVAAAELALLAALGAAALALAGPAWLVPVAAAAPLVAVELWFDMRSRGRRLTPELCGAIGVSAVAAAVALAGGAPGELATALWLVLAARAVATIPAVRVQITRLRRGTGSRTASDGAGAAGVAVALVAVALDPAVTGGALAVAAVAALQAVWVRRPPVPAKVLGFRQLGLGLGVVLATAVGTWIA